MYQTFSLAQADALLRMSEGKASKQSSSAPGHAAAAHLLITNDEMRGRYWKEIYKKHSKESLVITAFVDSASLAAAAQIVLNSKQAQGAMDILFYHRVSRDGLRAEIRYSGVDEFRMRYVASSGYAVQTMPATCFVMILYRYDGRPFRLHIQTFFGAIPFERRNDATIKGLEFPEVIINAGSA